ncbi:hypothetical protein HMPREF0988_00912 [Lachnospiraceae bacterium 1_4_56FAA]|nr:hypothetical protein HMPREF0988_00912 [Lachnospiraceae bacterium 1_4_56FAA]
MNEVKLFKNEEFGQVRMVLVEDEPYFVGKDVAEALGYADPSSAVSKNVDAEDKTTLLLEQDGSNYKSKTTVISESGLYALIFGSKLESAKKFKHWVTSEILPSIRKHGIYATDNVIDNILNNPDFGIELLTKLKEERVARVEAEKKNAILTHVNKTYTMTEIAKELNLKSATELNKILADKHIQYKVNNTWVFYSDYSNLGYEEIKQEVLDNGHVIYHRKITQMGRAFILRLFEEAVA